MFRCLASNWFSHSQGPRCPEVRGVKIVTGIICAAGIQVKLGTGAACEQRISLEQAGAASVRTKATKSCKCYANRALEIARAEEYACFVQCWARQAIGQAAFGASNSFLLNLIVFSERLKRDRAKLLLLIQGLTARVGASRPAIWAWGQAKYPPQCGQSDNISLARSVDAQAVGDTHVRSGSTAFTWSCRQRMAATTLAVGPMP